MRFPRARGARAVALLIAIGLMATGCGSKLSDQTLGAHSGGAGGYLGGSTTGSGAGGGVPGEATSGGVTGAGGAGGVAGPGGSSGSGSGGGGGGSGRRSEILFGSVGVASGLIGAVTESMRVAARAWVADVNARGGLDGHPVRVITEDDGGDPGRAVAIVRKMVEQDKVLALFNQHLAAGESRSVTEYLERHRIPSIGGSPIPDADTSPMYFNPQVGGTIGIYRAILSTIVAQTSARKIGILYCRESDSCPQGIAHVRSYADRAGVQIVYEAQVSIAQPDYTAEVLAARNAGADGIVFVIDAPSVIRAVRSARRQSWNPVFVATVAVYDQTFPAAGGSDVEGLVAFASVAPYSASPRMKPYLDAVRRYVPGGKIGGFGPETWTGAKLLERIAPFLGERPTRADLFEGLYSLRGETLGGLVPPLTFPRGSHRDVNLCTVPIRLQGGRWVAPQGDTFYCAREDGIKRL